MFLVPLAVAADAPSVAAGLEAGAAFGAPAPLAGAGLTVSVPFAGPVDLELLVDGGARVTAIPEPWGSGLAGLRVRLGEVWSVYGGGGGAWRDGPVAAGRVGVGWSPALLPIRLQVSGGWSGEPVALLNVDFVRRFARTTPLPRPAPVSLAPIPPPPTEERVWVPHPVCAWLPAEEAQRLAEDLGLDLASSPPGRVTELEPDALPAASPVPEGSTFGAVVVVALPGDRLSVGGRSFPIEEDGTAVFGAPVGNVTVRVEGGGRVAEVEGAVAKGYAIWLRAPPARSLVLTLLTDALTADSLDAARAWIAQRGDHRVRLVGLHQEWEPAIVGQRRAEAIVGQLRAIGLPEGALQRITTAVGTPGVRLESAAEGP